MTYATIVYAITVVDLLLYIALVWVFVRASHNPIMRAMAIYFSVMCAVYLAAVLIEGPIKVGVGHELYAEWRALFFRLAQGGAAGWLVWKLTRVR